MTRSWIWIIGIVSLVLTLSGVVTALYGLGFADRTLFEWMDILIVPIAVGIGLYLLEQSQRRREQNVQRQREEEREQDEALEKYFDQMRQMLLDPERSLLEDTTRTLARGWTLSILSILDPVRKGSVVKFLYEAALISAGQTVVDLFDADLNEAFLRNQSIPKVNLDGTHLREANLEAANLGAASVYRANLEGANLREANLEGANLRAVLYDADLREANLRDAYLSGANLRYAKLGKADLSLADLGDAKLSGANLSATKLSGAKGWTEEQLEQARSLEGATMFNGQRYEEWLKSRGEEEENSGPS
jgi:uncharacterized protein YjbI with pentapeptide repeats